MLFHSTFNSHTASFIPTIMAQTLLGLIGTLDPSTLIAVFIGLIFLLIIFETVIEFIEKLAEDAGYTELLSRLYKEMMMMGYLSFGIFLAFNAVGVKHNQKYLAFEFSHITTFFIAIFFVIRACLFVRYTRAVKNYFKKADAVSVPTLKDRYEVMKKHPNSFESILYNYFPTISSLRISIEYQILKCYFFKYFKLIPAEFRYVNYLSKSYKFYIIKLTEIRPICWIGPIVLILLNYLRVIVIGHVGIQQACHGGHHSTGHTEDDHSSSESLTETGSLTDSLTNTADLMNRGLSSNDDVSYHTGNTCEEYLIPYALFCSGLLVLYACLVAVITIQSKNKLLALAGVETEKDVLHTLNQLALIENYQKTKDSHGRRKTVLLPSSVDMLPSVDVLPEVTLSHRKTISELTHPSDEPSEDLPLRSPLPPSSSHLPPPTPFDRRERGMRHRQGSFLSFTSIPQPEYHIRTLRVFLNSHNEAKEKNERQLLHYYHHMTSTIFDMFTSLGNRTEKNNGMTPMMERVQSLRMHAQQEKELSSSSPKALRLHTGDDNDIELGGNDYLDNHFNAVDHHHHQQHDNEPDQSVDDEEEDDQSVEREMKKQVEELSRELNTVFPFSSRSLYEFLIQQMLLLDSLFLALWSTNLISISNHSTHPLEYNLLFLIPIVLMIWLNFIILFLSSGLFALTSLKNEGSKWLCEQDEICERVLPLLRQEILNILPNGVNDKKIEELYQMISSHQLNMMGSMRFSFDQMSEGKQSDLGINREGFAQFLHSLRIYPSEREIRALFRSMDKDDSGSIELPELKALLTDPHIKMVSKKKSFIDI